MKVSVNDVKDLEIYQEAMRIAELVWTLTDSWSSKAFNTMGWQIIRSVDSIAANISEGFGRYHHKENIKHCYYARGSLDETKTWLEKAAKRDVGSIETNREIYRDLTTLKKRLNAYIKTLNDLVNETKK